MTVAPVKRCDEDVPPPSLGSDFIGRIYASHIRTWAQTRDNIKKYLSDENSFTRIALDALAWAIGETRNYGDDHDNHVALAIEHMVDYILEKHPGGDPEQVFGGLYQTELAFHHGDDIEARGSVGKMILCREVRYA